MDIEKVRHAIDLARDFHGGGSKMRAALDEAIAELDTPNHMSDVAQPTGRLSSDQVMQIIREVTGGDLREMLTCKRWKDGIDIDVPTYAAETLAERFRAAQPPAAPVETCSRCGGSGLALNSQGEPDECRECKGNTVVPRSSAETSEQKPVKAADVIFGDLKQLWEALEGGPKPRCRDCADSDGNCPSDGLPCEPHDRALERIKRLRAVPQPTQETRIWQAAAIGEAEIGKQYAAKVEALGSAIIEARAALHDFQLNCRTDISRASYDALKRLETALTSENTSTVSRPQHLPTTNQGDDHA